MEAQEADAWSLCSNWFARCIRVRKQHPALWMGKLRFVNPSNRRVMAFVRTAPEETLLCVCNLARGGPQPAELDLSTWQGWTPIGAVRRHRSSRTITRSAPISCRSAPTVSTGSGCNRRRPESPHERHARGAHRLAQTPALVRRCGVPISKVEVRSASSCPVRSRLTPRPASVRVTYLLGTAGDGIWSLLQRVPGRAAAATRWRIPASARGCWTFARDARRVRGQGQPAWCAGRDSSGDGAEHSAALPREPAGPRPGRGAEQHQRGDRRPGPAHRCFRKLEVGLIPEVEVGRFLASARVPGPRRSCCAA